MKDCSTCAYSRHEQKYNILRCHVAPPHLEIDDGVSSLTDRGISVTSRPTVCSEYRRETALEQFLDMMPQLEKLIPNEFNSLNYEDHGVFWDSSVARMQLAYGVLKQYQTKGYPLSDKMLNHIGNIESQWPEIAEAYHG